MSSLFGKISADKTVLLVDIENGSVATALVRLSETEDPKLFGEHRIALPIQARVSSAGIAEQIRKAINESLGYTGEAAARIRQNKELSPMGTISDAQLFFGAPWSVGTLGAKGLAWSFDPYMLQVITRSAQTVVGTSPIHSHPFGSAAAHTANSISDGTVLVCILTGEIVELLLVEEGNITSRATVPVGSHTLLRTIHSHSGLSFPEAHSALRLYTQSPDNVRHIHEPLRATAQLFVAQFVEVAEDMLRTYPVENILVVGPQPANEWFARTISEHSQISQLFPTGGLMRALLPKHVTPYIAAHGDLPDLPLMMEAMFMNANQHDRFSGITL